MLSGSAIGRRVSFFFLSAALVAVRCAKQLLRRAGGWRGTGLWVWQRGLVVTVGRRCISRVGRLARQRLTGAIAGPALRTSRACIHPGNEQWTSTGSSQRTHSDVLTHANQPHPASTGFAEITRTAPWRLGPMLSRVPSLQTVRIVATVAALHLTRPFSPFSVLPDSCSLNLLHPQS